MRAALVNAAHTPRWHWLLPVLLLVGAFHFSGISAALDRAFYDAASRRPWQEPALGAAGDSALILIDERTLQEQAELGLRWPWPRAAFAGLIAVLERAGAERVLMDFTFFEPDLAEQDLLLAAVAAVARPTVLGRTEARAPAFWGDAFREENPAYFSGAVRMGDVTFDADSDGVARRYASAFSLAAAATTEPAQERGGLLRWYGGIQTLATRGVPVLSASAYLREGQALLARLGEQAPDGDLLSLAFDLRQLEHALSQQPPIDGPLAAAVRGRTVFVGANASGTFDVKPLPISRLEPGVLLHWTAWANLVNGTIIAEIPRWAGLVVAAGCVVALGAIGVRGGRLWQPILTATAMVAAVVVMAYWGLSAGWFFPPATPAAAAIFALVGVAAEGLWAEQKRRREVQAIFGSYVDPGVVETLVRDPAAIRLGGEKRHATVFFCDLAGFTDLSEQVSPETLLALINQYLEEVSDSLLSHGAYIDKYIGDAIMAVFGAPQADPEHALAAGRAALAAQRVLARMNQQIEREHGRTLHMRIGLNTGEMIVGNLGSPRKRNYTVLGDAVNLASRLEGANKSFGTSILVGDETARLIGERLVLRPLTRLRVKGKQQAVEVFELVAAPEELTPRQADFLRHYRLAYGHYVQREHARASAGFAAALEFCPDDAMTQALLTDARRLAAVPPPADWEPVLTLSSK